MSLLSLFKKNQASTDTSSDSSDWNLFKEGKLLIDMYERPDSVVVRSLVAGVIPEELEISIYNDVLTIRGVRKELDEIHNDRFFHQECYWGTFSRSIIIPVPIYKEGVRAFFKHGVVTIELPKL